MSCTAWELQEGWQWDWELLQLLNHTASTSTGRLSQPHATMAADKSCSRTSPPPAAWGGLAGLCLPVKTNIQRAQVTRLVTGLYLKLFPKGSMNGKKLTYIVKRMMCFI